MLTPMLLMPEVVLFLYFCTDKLKQEIYFQRKQMSPTTNVQRPTDLENEAKVKIFINSLHGPSNIPMILNLNLSKVQDRRCKTYFGHNVTAKLQVRGGIHIIFFLFLHENICCGYSLEAPCHGASNKYHNICLHENICCLYSLEVSQQGTSNEYP